MTEIADSVAAPEQISAAPADQVWQVAVAAPLGMKLLDYILPADLFAAELCAAGPGAASPQDLAGRTVLVPLGSRDILGWLVRLSSEAPGAVLKHAIELMDVEHAIPSDMMALADRLAAEYSVPPASLLVLLIPKSAKQIRRAVVWNETDSDELFLDPDEDRARSMIQANGGAISFATFKKNLGPRAQKIIPALKKKGRISLISSLAKKRRADLGRPPEAAASGPSRVLDPTPSQGRAIENILPSVEGQVHRTFLLFGPTASGKTLVYEQLTRVALRRGRQVLFLVPEILLTRAIIPRVQRALPGVEISVMHSRMTDAQRRREWQRCAQGSARVLVGPRSAAFVPLPDLGLIIVDECHDASYKQQDDPFVDARRVAAARAELRNIPLVMGSATPSVEQLYACERGTVTRLDLTERPLQQHDPAVIISDLKVLKRDTPEQAAMKRSMITPELLDALRRTVQSRQAAILLLNRRGYSPLVICPNCGFVERCPDCMISLNYHKQNRRLICHGCNREEPVTDQCKVCGRSLAFQGTGTQKLEQIAAKYVGECVIVRLDSDSLRREGAEVDRVLEKLERKEIDILVGTQMIAKGLDYPHVTLSAIILADIGLSIPDYRSTERVFQMIAQLVGRAGRGKIQGCSIIQTYDPGHQVIKWGVRQDVAAFYAAEIVNRQQGNWPPFVRLGRVNVEGEQPAKVMQIARSLYERIQAGGVDVAAPRWGAYPKREGAYRLGILFRLPPDQNLELSLATSLVGTWPGQVRSRIEMDPASLTL